MNNDIYMLFARLCNDLGLRPRDQVTFPLLQKARNALLLAAESADSHGSWGSEETRSFYECFNECFSHYERRYSKVWRTAVFRDAYQALCYPLKVETTYTDKQEDEYLKRFIQNEESCRTWYTADFAHSELFRLAKYAVRLAGSAWDLRPGALQGLCRHGPGAVAQRVRGDDKNIFTSIQRMPYQLSSWCGVIPFYANEALASEAVMASIPLTRYSFRKCGSGRYKLECETSPVCEKSGYAYHDRVVARLNLVPKDWKGPRGVFISPKEAVWCQLGIWEAIRRSIPHTWLSQCYDPGSQSPSQEAAYQGSIDRSNATLDLSDASDRIPSVLVRMLFDEADWPALAATRPSVVEFPDGSWRKLYMFAPMGDGKTFPILTIVCAAIVLSAVLIDDGWGAARLPSNREMWEYARRIRVFGDDIIVPRRNFATVCQCLQLCNLKVNVGKSFVQGYFRESCGMDAYRGVDCTPLRLRFQPNRRPDVETVQKAVDLHNRTYAHRPDLHNTIAWLENYVISSRWPTGYTSRSDIAPSLLQCPMTHVLQKNMYRKVPLRFNTDLQRVEVLSWTVPKHRTCLSSSEPWWDLNHYLLTAHHEPAGVHDVPGNLSTKTVSGSPITERLWEEISGSDRVPIPSETGQRTWVPVGPLKLYRNEG